MYAKRLKCSKCGRTLLTGFTKNVESVQCSCGYITYPNDEKVQRELSKAERRHSKYERS